MNAPDRLIPPPEVAPRPARKPPICLAVPSHDHVHANFAFALANLSCYCGIRDQPVVFCNNKGSLVQVNRNNGVAEAQKWGCSHILFLDSDMTFPMRALEQLLAHGKKIVGATYAQRSNPHKNLAKPKGQVPIEIKAGELVEVDALPTGCLLVELSVFEDLKRPYFRCGFEEEAPGVEPRILGEDYDFCDRARAAGHSIWLDVGLSFEVIHWGEAGWRLDDEICGVDASKPDAVMLEVARG